MPYEVVERMYTIDANHLIDVRGGGITVQIIGPAPFEMRMQHNETFIRV